MNKPLRLFFLLILTLFCATISAGSAQEDKRFHTISQGETLYRLTQLYHVSAQAICDANPGLSAQNFKAGTVILIPSSTDTELTKTDTVAVTLQPEPAGIAGSNCREMYKAKRKDTLYGIAVKYDISLQELQKANPETLNPDFKLKKGYVLCIPFKQTVPEKIEKPEPTNEELFSSSRKRETGLKLIKIGVVLPLKNATSPNTKMIDFYRGLLMAVDTLKHRGVSFEVRAYNLPAGSSTASLLQKDELKELNVIFAPSDSGQIASLSAFTKQNKILLVSPFYRWSSEVETNPQFIVLNPPLRYQNAEAMRLFRSRFSSDNIVIFQTGKASEPFVKLFETENIPYTTFPLPSTEKGLAACLKADRKNIILLNSADERSLTVLISLLQSLRLNRPEYAFHLFGYPKWQTYTSALDDLYNADTYIYTPFYINHDASEFKRVTRRYLNNFKEPMPTGYPRMALYGYDCGLYILSGMAEYGQAFGEQKIDASTLQNHFMLKRVHPWGGLINHSVKLVHFCPDHTIDEAD